MIMSPHGGPPHGAYIRGFFFFKDSFIHSGGCMCACMGGRVEGENLQRHPCHPECRARHGPPSHDPEIRA